MIHEKRNDILKMHRIKKKKKKSCIFRNKNNDFFFSALICKENLAHPLTDWSDTLFQWLWSQCNVESCITSRGVVILHNLGKGKHVDIEQEEPQNTKSRNPRCNPCLHWFRITKWNKCWTNSAQYQKVPPTPVCWEICYVQNVKIDDIRNLSVAFECSTEI